MTEYEVSRAAAESIIIKLFKYEKAKKKMKQDNPL